MCSDITSLNSFKNTCHRLHRLSGDVQRTFCRMAGIVDSLQLRATSTALIELWLQAWTTYGSPLLPCSESRARHPLAHALGFFDEPLLALRPVTARALYIATMRRGQRNSAASKQVLDLKRYCLECEFSRSKDAEVVEWLLHGCYKLLPHAGLQDDSANSHVWLLASGFTFGSKVVLPPKLGCMPWPSSRVMLRALRENPLLGRGAAVLELGAGCGLVGLALSNRARSVILTDGEPSCLDALRLNASLRACRGSAKIDVCGPLQFGEVLLPGRDGNKWFDLIIANDVLYPAQMAHTLKLLWATVDAFLLKREHCHESYGSQADGVPDSSSFQGFLLNYVSRSIKEPPLMEDALRHGFEARLLAREAVVDPAPSAESVPETVQCSVLFFYRSAR